MSYQVLARKYRPHNFHDMAGQNHVLQALINALDSKRLHHAYLFTGTRGVGKTTIARIFAKCLNCEEGISSKPCGVCKSCIAIDDGRFVDLIEVDAASRTKVDDTRELLDNVQYAPTNGRFKVYLIDEVHMLSSHSFNALLKTLEEPPARVKFLLATTDPQKLPVTVLSRCLQFSLKALANDVIANYLAQILTKEQINFDDNSLQLLAKSGQGSMRDALSLTDQAIAFGGGKLITADIRAMLGDIDTSYIYDLFQALISGDAKQILAIIQNIALQGIDFMNALNELLSLIHEIAITQLAGNNNQKVMQLAQSISASDLQFYYQIGLIGKRDLSLAPNAQAGFEMILLRMLVFRPAHANYAPNTPLKTDLEHSAQTKSNVQNNGNSSVSSAKQDLPAPNNAVLANKDTSININGPNIADELPTKSIINDLPKATNDTDNLVSDFEELPATTTQIKQQQLPSAQMDNDLPPIDAYDDLPPVDIYDDIALDFANDNFTPNKSSVNSAQDVQENNSITKQNTKELPKITVNSQQSKDTNTNIPANTIQTNATDNLLSKDLVDKWYKLVTKLQINGLSKVLATNCALIKVDGNNWHMQLDPKFNSQFNKELHTKIEQALQNELDLPIVLHVSIQKHQYLTPAKIMQNEQNTNKEQLKTSVYNDPNIKYLIEHFSVTIEHIEPIL